MTKDTLLRWRLLGWEINYPTILGNMSTADSGGSILVADELIWAEPQVLNQPDLVHPG